MSAAQGWRKGLSHIYLRILKSLLQVVVDRFVRDLADQCEIRYPHLLLLGGLEDGFLCELCLLAAAAGLFRATGILLAPGALCYRLYERIPSQHSGPHMKRQSAGNHTITGLKVRSDPARSNQGFGGRWGSDMRRPNRRRTVVE